MTAFLQVEIVYALSHIQILEKLNVSAGCTVEQAIKYSGILDQFPEIDLTKNKLGIFGRFVQPESRLSPCDRVEIYRPLIIDPKEARRIRAKKSLCTENRR
ncbi:RnfH family protein [Nitrosomonas sp.]|uniref:RnfH family protein n=1 Tax=Nitrosomonas sp. TaxID=42353 RepID=UPI00374D368D